METSVDASGQSAAAAAETNLPLLEDADDARDMQVLSVADGSASCKPSTQIRLARATRAGVAPRSSEPEAVRVAAGATSGDAGDRSATGVPATMNAPSRGSSVWSRPCRSRITTRCGLNDTIAPTTPEARCSMTSPIEAAAGA